MLMLGSMQESNSGYLTVMGMMNCSLYHSRSIDHLSTSNGCFLPPQLLIYRSDTSAFSKLCQWLVPNNYLHLQVGKCNHPYENSEHLRDDWTLSSACPTVVIFFAALLNLNPVTRPLRYQGGLIQTFQTSFQVLVRSLC